MGMEMNEQSVIVGAGIAGLATALALHRYNPCFLLLSEVGPEKPNAGIIELPESNHSQLGPMRGRRLMLLAWVIHSVHLHSQIHGVVAMDAETEAATAEVPNVDKTTSVISPSDNAAYSMKCKCKKEGASTNLANELPSGTIRFSSKMVSIEESGHLKGVASG
ncbi:hypothetical protein Ancab_028111 [Ancistrocladus abbreviatus]